MAGHERSEGYGIGCISIATERTIVKEQCYKEDN